jgi:SOS-response transcriptional repressor LexA
MQENNSDKSTIIDKLLIFIEKKNISKRVFYNETGLSNGSLDKGSTLRTDSVEKVISAYPELNIEWLITGKGEMFKILPNPEITKATKGDGIPLLTESAWAGFNSNDVTVLEIDCEKYVIPVFKGADFLIPVKGSSMVPKYSSGDLVACKWLPLDTFFQWNKVYVLDTIQGPLIKRIKKGKDEDHLLIISENERYEPYDLHRNEIRKLALVIGVIRLE